MLKRSLVIAIATTALIAATVFVALEIRIDRCLDAGGEWNYDGDYCKEAP